jgi:hypothetical protein
MAGNDAKRAVAEASAIPLLVKLMRYGSDEAKTNAAGALVILSDGNAATSGNIESSLGNIESTSGNIQSNVCGMQLLRRH